MSTRSCQICRTDHPLEEYYTKDVYICKNCNTLVANFSRFKKLIKINGINIVKNIIINERLLLDAKEGILCGSGINNAVRLLIGRGYNDNKK